MFAIGQRVTWIVQTWAGAIPIKAVVLSVGPKRVKVGVTSVRTGEQVVKFVSADNLRDWSTYR